MALVALFCITAAVTAAPLARRQAPSGVPAFVTQYAPLVFLHSADPYGPSDFARLLTGTQPEVNFTVVGGGPEPLTLDNLNELNGLGGEDVYLTAVQDIEQDPAWLHGEIPDETGKTGDAITCAIIVNDHGNGSVDAFYMYFFAFNYGGDYLGFNIGNHVGDWEHNMIRFQDGVPQALWYSQHAEGQAFQYRVLEKQGDRPIAYSSNGSHAIYATSGPHDHTIPNIDLPVGPLVDVTDKGPLWDPTLSAYYYRYDTGSDTFTAYDDADPVEWLSFTGHWGDKRYPESDPRQDFVLGIKALAKYGNGPTGPLDKQLDRAKICPENGHLCIVRALLTS